MRSKYEDHSIEKRQNLPIHNAQLEINNIKLRACYLPLVHQLHLFLDTMLRGEDS